MNPVKRLSICRTLLAFALLLLPAAGLPAAAQADSPAWQLSLTSLPTNFAPGDQAGAQGGTYPLFALYAINTGSAPSSGPITLTLQLPAGTSFSPSFPPGTKDQLHVNGENTSCQVSGQLATCTNPNTIAPGEWIVMEVPVDVDALPDPTQLVAEGAISGGGGGGTGAQTTTTVTGGDPSFGLLSGREGLNAGAVDADGVAVTQAGSHPHQLNLNLGLPTLMGGSGVVVPQGTLHDARVDLPSGVVVNPAAADQCTEAQLITGACPDSSQVGVATIPLSFGGFSPDEANLYNMVPPAGAPAAFAFVVQNVPVHIIGGVRPDDYRITSLTSDAIELLTIFSAQIQLWGVPTDPSHDDIRGACGPPANAGGGCAVTRTDVPLLTMPTSCTDEVRVDASIDVWEDLGTFYERSEPLTDANGNPTGTSGCSQVPFDPSIDLVPTTTRADSSSGMDVKLSVPQDGLLDRDGIASAHLKRAVVTLPEGMSLNPSAADGLEGCTTAQIGLISTSPIRFDGSEPACPDGSKVGSAVVRTPLLPDSMEGELFLADQDDNPFDALLSGYLVARGPGIMLKIPGVFETDPDTGQIKAIFNNNPQLPFTEFELHFKSGSRGVLVTPPTCGIYEIESRLSPWSAADPENPTEAETVIDTSTFTVDKAPDGGPCVAGDPSQPADQADRADLPFAPKMTAGAVTPLAGQSSPFVLRLTRSYGEQELKRISADLPPGVVAKLAGVDRCSDAALAGISGALGAGQAELNSPSCPANSQVGRAVIGAGAGSTPMYLNTSKAYLAGPYDPDGAGPLGQAPISLAIVSPAVAGPFDLGNVVVRTALYVDQDDAQVHAVSEPIPHILHGIPLHIRDIRVVMDRAGFTLNPTNCNPMTVTGQITGAGETLASTADDTTASVSDRFQVSGCGGLGFSPKLSGQILNGQDGIHRSDHPNLLFDLKGTPGDANMSRVEVTLPQNFQIDQANLGNICSETQLATQDCAGRQRVGTASAITPLLDVPLSGPVYAVSGSGGLPKLALILYGPPSMPIKLVVRGVTETVGARIKNTFPLVPDAPVSSFALNLDGGDKGYLVNNSDLCGSSSSKSKGKGKKKKKGKGKRSIASAAKKKKKGKKKNRSSAAGIAADATFFGQNGDILRQSVPISADCGTARSGGKKKGKGGKKRKGKRSSGGGGRR